MFLHTKDFYHKPYNIYFRDSCSGEGATKIFKHANTRGIEWHEICFSLPWGYKNIAKAILEAIGPSSWFWYCTVCCYALTLHVSSWLQPTNAYFSIMVYGLIDDGRCQTLRSKGISNAIIEWRRWINPHIQTLQNLEAALGPDVFLWWDLCSGTRRSARPTTEQ